MVDEPCLVSINLGIYHQIASKIHKTRVRIVIISTVGPPPYLPCVFDDSLTYTKRSSRIQTRPMNT